MSKMSHVVRFLKHELHDITRCMTDLFVTDEGYNFFRAHTM